MAQIKSEAAYRVALKRIFAVFERPNIVNS